MFERHLSAFLAAQVPPKPAGLHPGDRLVLVAGSLGPGGAERQWCYLARGLKRRGYDVTLAVTLGLNGDRGHYLPLLAQDRIPLVDLTQPLDAQGVVASPLGDADPLLPPLQDTAGPALLPLAGLLRALAPKAVFGQHDPHIMTAALAGISARVPCVVLSFRSQNPSHFPFHRDWFLPAYRALCRAAQVVLAANSRSGCEDYAHWIGIPAERVTYIPNGIDPDSFRRAESDALARVRSELGWEPGAPVIAGVGRISDQKCPDVFVDVCAQVAAAVPGLRVIWAGAGADADIRRRIADRGLQHSITLLGARDDIPALLSCATLLLHTSRVEGMPNAVMEAQLLGLPVVATRAGGVADCVVDGATGFVREVGDVSGLAEACIRLLTSPELVRRFGSAGAERMRSVFPEENMVTAYLRLVENHGGAYAKLVGDLKRAAGGK